MKPREVAYNVLRRILSQDARIRLRQEVVHTRRRLAPLYRMRYGTFTATELCDELARKMAADTEIVMVHCSLNDLEPMYTGSPLELLDALIELCAPDKTLAMPAFFFGGRDGDPTKYYSHRAVFDARRQPSQMGVLSEIFRRRQGVLRSLHPTASVCAFGPLAEELTQGHHLAPRTFGEGTPFARMAQHNTTIFGIGTEYFRCLSQVHAAEDLLEDSYPLPIRRGRLSVEIRDVDGGTHQYELPISESDFGRRTELLGLLVGDDELVRWRFHGVSLFATSARLVTDVLMQAALRGETIYNAAPIQPRAGSRSRGLPA